MKKENEHIAEEKTVVEKNEQQVEETTAEVEITDDEQQQVNKFLRRCHWVDKEIRLLYNLDYESVLIKYGDGRILTEGMKKLILEIYKEKTQELSKAKQTIERSYLYGISKGFEIHLKEVLKELEEFYQTQIEKYENILTFEEQKRLKQ
jgi:hypothetical protein